MLIRLEILDRQMPNFLPPREFSAVIMIAVCVQSQDKKNRQETMPPEDAFLVSSLCERCENTELRLVSSQRGP